MNDTTPLYETTDFSIEYQQGGDFIEHPAGVSTG